MLNIFAKKTNRPQIYATFELSVWFVNGQAVLYFGNSDYDEIVAFKKEILPFARTNGNLPENFFDDITENMKDAFKQFVPTPASYIDEELSKELKELYDERSDKHNLIWNSKMFSIKESDYYLHRELFPKDWEDCFQNKEYFFVLLKDRGFKMKVDDEIVNCNDGYIQISAMSLMDAKTFYEEWLCHNTKWRGEQVWAISHEPMDCDSIIPAITRTKRERYPEDVKVIEGYHRAFGLFSGKKCYQRIVIDKEWKI